MKTFLALLLFVCKVTLMFSQSEEMKKGIRSNIDWIWNAAGNAPPAQLKVWACPVVIGANGEIPSIRGPIGAVSCGNYAVLYALAGNKAAAIKWLMAAQGHNDAAANDFATYTDFTIDYAVSQHTNQALVRRLGSTVTDVIRIKEAIFGKLNGHAPASQPPPAEREREPRDGGATHDHN